MMDWGVFFVGAGVGFLAGAVVFDLAWRHVRRLEAKLRASKEQSNAG